MKKSYSCELNEAPPGGAGIGANGRFAQDESIARSPSQALELFGPVLDPPDLVGEGGGVADRIEALKASIQKANLDCLVAEQLPGLDADARSAADEEFSVSNDDLTIHSNGGVGDREAEAAGGLVGATEQLIVTEGELHHAGGFVRSIVGVAVL